MMKTFEDDTKSLRMESLISLALNAAQNLRNIALTYHGPEKPQLVAEQYISIERYCEELLHRVNPEGSIKPPGYEALQESEEPEPETKTDTPNLMDIANERVNGKREGRWWNK